MLGAVSRAGTGWCWSLTLCDSSGDWLPFTTLTDRRRGIHYGTGSETTAGEVVWTQETEPIGLWAYAEPARIVSEDLRRIAFVRP